MEKAKPRVLPLNKRGMNFEMFMWIITRLTALAMYGLILTAIVGALIMGALNQMNLADVLRWGFMPNSGHLQSVPLENAEAWATPFWLLVGSALLLIACAHGVHGLVAIADDYIVTPRGRKIVRLLSIVMMGGMSIIGLYVLWTA